MATSQLISQSKRAGLQLTARNYLGAVVWLAILALAIYLRFTALDYSLPFVDGDENPIVEHALALSLDDLNPHMFYYGSLPFYVFKLVCVGAEGLSRAFVGPALAFPDYVLVLRYFSALASMVTIFLVFAFGRLVADSRVGLLSAAIFTLSPLAIDLAHNATVDALLGVWCGLALVGIALWIRGNSRGRTLAALAVGLAVSTKFNAAIFLVALFLIAYLEERARGSHELARSKKIAFVALVLAAIPVYLVALVYRDSLLELAASWSTRGQLQPAYVSIFDRLLKLALVAVAASVALAVGVARRWRWPSELVRTALGASFLQPVAIVCAVFALTSPYVILDFPTFTREFFFQVQHVASPTTIAYEVGSRSYQAAAQTIIQHDPWQYVVALRDEWGILVFLMMLIGLWSLWRSAPRVALPLTVLCGAIFAVTLGWSYLALRYMYPLWPAFVVLAGVGMGVVVGKATERLRPRGLGNAGAALFALVLLAMPLASSFDNLQRSFIVPDTRNLALAWIDEHVLPGTVILRELGTPNLEALSSNYHVYATDTAFEEQSLSQWQQRGVEVILLGDRRRQFYQDHAAEFQDVLSAYRTITADWNLAAAYVPGQDRRGSPVYVYVRDVSGKQ